VFNLSNIDKLDVLDLIDTHYWCMSDAEREFWKLVKVSPQIWKGSPSGKNYYSFWAVAIFGNKVIWYNHIEEGFELSEYSTLGEIDNYQATQAELHNVIKRCFPWK